MISKNLFLSFLILSSSTIMHGSEKTKPKFQEEKLEKDLLREIPNMIELIRNDSVLTTCLDICTRESSDFIRTYEAKHALNRAQALLSLDNRKKYLKSKDFKLLCRHLYAIYIKKLSQNKAPCWNALKVYLKQSHQD